MTSTHVEKQESKPSIIFHCSLKSQGCGAQFKSTEYETTDHPEREWYPYQHKTSCPECGRKGVKQAHWQLAAWRSSQVGKSPEGRARISAANKARDPASYEASRFNAMTHGASAQVAQFYPARPGKYMHCSGCDYLYDGCGSTFQYCVRRTETFVRFAAAQESGDTRLLGGLLAGNQAALNAMLADMMLAVNLRGVEIELPVYSKDPETGQVKVETYVDDNGAERVLLDDVKAHPLIPQVINFFAKNGTTLADLALTPRAEKEEQRFQGFLDSKEEDREALRDLLESKASQRGSLNSLIGSRSGRVIEADVGESSDD